MNITPKGKQKEVLALPSTGHTVVLGTAGSGKTTIALLRAYHLATLPGNKKVLLVTFNGALVEYIILKVFNTKLIPIYIAPDVLTTRWSNMIKNGRCPTETLFDCSSEEV